MRQKLSEKASCALAQIRYRWMDDCETEGQTLNDLLECLADIEGDHRADPFEEGVPIDVLAVVMQDPEAKKEVCELVNRLFDVVYPKLYGDKLTSPHGG